jgi:hypothetical protein
MAKRRYTKRSSGDSISDTTRGSIKDKDKISSEQDCEQEGGVVSDSTTRGPIKGKIASKTGAQNDKQEGGNVPAVGDSPAAEYVPPLTRTVVDVLKTTMALRKCLNWTEIEGLRDTWMHTLRIQGVPKYERQQRTYAELARRFLPPPMEKTDDPKISNPPAVTSSGIVTVTMEADDGISGLSDVPEDWPALPPNASLQAEVSWVQANRLSVMVAGGVDLGKALTPAPSYAALGWLETSIRAYSKWCDIAARATSNQELEGESIKREKRSIEEMRAILAEMMPDGARPEN